MLTLSLCSCLGTDFFVLMSFHVLQFQPSTHALTFSYGIHRFIWLLSKYYILASEHRAYVYYNYARTHKVSP